MGQKSRKQIAPHHPLAVILLMIDTDHTLIIKTDPWNYVSLDYFVIHIEVHCNASLCITDCNMSLTVTKDTEISQTTHSALSGSTSRAAHFDRQATSLKLGRFISAH